MSKPIGHKDQRADPTLGDCPRALGEPAGSLSRGMGLGQVVEEMIEVQERDVLICSSLPGVVGAHKPAWTSGSALIAK